MVCSKARALLIDRQRGTLSEDDRVALEEHLGSCETCRHESAVEKELTAALRSRLRRQRAPERLRRTLDARWDAPARRVTGAGVARTVGSMAIGALLALAAVYVWHSRAPDNAMIAEAVNDHLRVLYSDHPLGVESGGIHQVKPWFEGRLDFAPVVPFEGDEDFKLQGGAVAYFVDRKAATFVYKRRLHVMTLFVFRADGLGWPATASRAGKDPGAVLRTARGFHVLMWRGGDLGYALVSDVDPRELTTLAARIAGGG
jgi:anti-sigma factor RsiW